MRSVFRFVPVLLLCASLCGCGRKDPKDSDLPPGVRKNENRNTGVSTSRKGKPFLIDQNKQAP